MQIVEIAKALSLNARVLLLDEPTASITDHEAAALFAVLRRLQDAGVAIVFVSHKLEEVLAICDRVSVLRDGKVVAMGEPIAGVTRQRLVSLMIGRDERGRRHRRARSPTKSVELELEALATRSATATSTCRCARARSSASMGWSGPAGPSLRAHPGRRRDHRGRSECAAAGAHPSMHEAVERYGIGYVSEDRKEEGLILAYPIRDNIAITIWRRIAGALGLVSRNAEARAASRSSEAGMRAPLARAAGRHAFGRQPAESFDREMAGGAHGHPHHRRADRRHRRQDQGRAPRADRRSRARASRSC